MPSKRDKHRYVKVRWDDLSCICTPAEVADMTADSDDPFTTEDVWMTDAEYMRLPEFEGGMARPKRESVMQP